MSITLARCAAAVAMMLALSGCLYEATLDASGGGSMSIMLRGTNRRDLDGLKNKMSSRTVKVLSAEFSGEDSNGQAAFKLQFDDVTKLSSAEFFRNVAIKRTDGIEGSQVVTAIVRNTKTTVLSDAQIERLGQEVKVVVTFPGDVIESNGTITPPRTVTWTWQTRSFFQDSENMMTAAYKPPTTPAAAAPTAAATPAS
jgi:hypothetical protein